MSLDEANTQPDRLPDLTKVAPEDRDRVWFEHYYQGDRAPQLTLRAVLMGGLLGGVMSVCNLYTTLKLGWAFGVAITACVLSYAIWNSFVASGIAKTKMSILENNCMQSTASAAGYSTGGTIATAAGAMLLITGDAERLGIVPLGIWVFFVAVLGVFLAIPMKRQMINQEQLPFPSGIAAAETLRSLYAEGQAAMVKARDLIDALIVGGFVGLGRSFAVIPESIAWGGGALNTARGPIGLGSLGLSFEPSVLLIAAGAITGMRVCVSMMLGAVLNFVILVPFIAGLDDWSAPGKHFVGHYEAVLGEGGAIEFLKITRWSLWFGTAVLVSSGLTAFALSWKTILKAFTGARAGAGGNDAAMAAIEVPTSWMIIGLVPTTLGLMAVCWLAMGINPLLGFVSVVLSGALALVACRATGETDTTPIGAMGKITQFVYAVIAPADKTVNLMTAGITAGAAGSSADLLTDLKSGYLLGANPRQQFLAQFYGVFFGIVTVVPMWYVLVPNKEALEKFNSPATTMWYAVAEALSTGVGTIPESARWAIVVGALIGIAFPLLENLFPKARPYLPSTMGFGLAFVIPFANSLGFFLGALIASRWTGRDPKAYEEKIIPLASGAIAGESLASAGYAVLQAARVILPG
ncbi:MAG: OPT/YSL family transporter [Deltaproteobacteria bacterium]|nr:OPT/YSL family transporter [Deltaproteobacteria bacterium]